MRQVLPVDACGLGDGERARREPEVRVGVVLAQRRERCEAQALQNRRAVGAEVLAELAVPFHRTSLTNARIERITGRTTTWRDLGVVRAIDERWGA